MAEAQEHIKRFMCQWIKVDKKKISASTDSNAALVMLGADTRAKVFQIILKANTPNAKEKVVNVIQWEHISTISISRKRPIHQLTLSLNKLKSKHSKCVIAVTPQVLEGIYEVLNEVLAHIMSLKASTKCGKHMKILGAFDMQREPKQENPGSSPPKPSPTLKIDELLNSMIQTMDQKDLGDNVRVVLAELPKEEAIVDTDDSESEDSEESKETSEDNDQKEETKDEDSKEKQASEENGVTKPEENKIEEARKEDLSSVTKVCQCQDNLRVDPNMDLEVDFYQFINLPFAFVVIFSLFVKIVFYFFLNAEI